MKEKKRRSLNDVCRCLDGKCPVRETCVRWVGRYDRGEWISYAQSLRAPEESPEGPCSSFMEI